MEISIKIKTIKDFFGKETNLTVYQLHITPENTKNIELLFFKLKNILNITSERINILKSSNDGFEIAENLLFLTFHF